MDLADNFNSVQRRIAGACARVGRDPSCVLLVAVSKGHPPEAVRCASDLGINLFGENRVQEARAKIPLCPGHIRWHMIGHLQTNKVRDALPLFEMIQSVDSLRLATELDKWADRMGRTVSVLLEVNVAGESTKYGYTPEMLLTELQAINTLKRLEIRGLMTMAPWTTEPERVRPVFRRLREVKARCEQMLGAPLQHLSMGMTSDFEVAIEEGATMVRIGTALFGERSPATISPADRP